MRVSALEDLPSEPTRAIIINVGTELVTTLALVSAVEHAGMPVLLVNCDPTAASSAHFDRLAAKRRFDILDAPRRPHFQALNRLFRQVKADVVFLLDSDAEVRDSRFVERLRSCFDTPRVFGAGFITAPMWLDERSGGCAPRTALYQERPWLPCVMFRTSHVRSALDEGITFAPRIIYNDFMWSRKISKGLAARFQTTHVPRLRLVEQLPAPLRARLRSSRLPWLEWARQDYFGFRPNYVVCDAGARVYQWCKYQRRLIFAGVDTALRTRDEIVHFGGVTRAELGRADAFTHHVADVEAEVIDRLARVYGIDWAECRERMGES
jgi:hypothetical protein